MARDASTGLWSPIIEFKEVPPHHQRFVGSGDGLVYETRDAAENAALTMLADTVRLERKLVMTTSAAPGPEPVILNTLRFDPEAEAAGLRI